MKALKILVGIKGGAMSSRKELDEAIAELETNFILPTSDLEKLLVCAFDKGRLAKNVGGGLSSIDVDTYEAHTLLVRCLCECYIKVKE